MAGRENGTREAVEMDMTKIANYRNDSTGELAPAHVLGNDAHGRTLYLGTCGWTPVDASGEEVDVEADADGNWTVASTKTPAGWRP